jgi:tripartite ATP-independent transporter DctM subunit
MAPVILVGGIVSGLYTATEGGVITCMYGLIIGMFYYRELKIGDFVPLLSNAVQMTAAPLFILACASVFGFLLSIHGFGTLLVNILKSFNPGPTTLLLIMVVLLLIIGLVVEGMAALIIFVPVFMPLIPAFGLDPIHLALIILVTLLLGTVTPPVGIQLYIAATIGNIKIHQVEVFPFVIAILFVVVLMVLFPPIVTFIPTFFLGKL